MTTIRWDRSLGKQTNSLDWDARKRAMQLMICKWTERVKHEATKRFILGKGHGGIVLD